MVIKNHIFLTLLHWNLHQIILVFKTKIKSFSFQHSAVQIAGLTDATIQLHVIVNQGEKEIYAGRNIEINGDKVNNTGQIYDGNKVLI